MTSAPHRLVLSSLVFALGCSPQAAPSAASAAPALPASSSAPSSLAPRPLPARTTVHMHLPGPDPQRHLNVTVDVGRGVDWFIEGCVSAVAGACFATRQLVVRHEDRVPYVQLWAAVYAMPKCDSTRAPPPARPLELDGPAGHFEDALPEDATHIVASTAGACRAPARLAVWVAQRFGAL